MTLRTFFAALAVILFMPTFAFAQETSTGITMENPWIRATPPNAPVAGGFVLLTNTGDADDRLIGGEVNFAGEVQVHEMKIVDDVMRMRQLADGLLIPAGESVLLKPGSFHLMFMKLGEQLMAGEKRSVTMIFAEGGEVVVEFDVMDMSKSGKSMDMKKTN